MIDNNENTNQETANNAAKKPEINAAPVRKVPVAKPAAPRTARTSAVPTKPAVSAAKPTAARATKPTVSRAKPAATTPAAPKPVTVQPAKPVVAKEEIKPQVISETNV